MRKEFPDAIYWTGSLVTDADGTAKVQLAYPDALTTWRVTARAVTPDTLVGTTVARTTITKDLIVRVVTPRFLTEGDEVVVPTIVHNYLPADEDGDVTMKADGVSVPAGQAAPQPQRLEIAQAGESAERLAVRSRTGWARRSSRPPRRPTWIRDAVELTIPVLPFGLKRTAGAAARSPARASARRT